MSIAWIGLADNDLVRIIISTDGSTSQREQAEQLNACRYVEMPFTPEAILDVLASLL